eukprot:IDg20964t1
MRNVLNLGMQPELLCKILVGYAAKLLTQLSNPNSKHAERRLALSSSRSFDYRQASVNMVPRTTIAESTGLWRKTIQGSKLCILLRCGRSKRAVIYVYGTFE